MQVKIICKSCGYSASVPERKDCPLCKSNHVEIKQVGFCRQCGIDIPMEREKVKTCIDCQKKIETADMGVRKIVEIKRQGKQEKTLTLHPEGLYTLLIKSLTNGVSQAGNTMYIITLTDVMQGYLPIYDYIVYFENNGSKTFYPRDEKKISSLLKACNVHSIEEIEGHRISVNVKYDHVRGRKIEEYYIK